MKRITSLLLAIVLFAGLVLVGAPTAHAASEMKASDALVEFLKNEEGFSAKPYWDYAQYTVGYGTRCPDDMLEEYKTNGISKEAAETLLRNYLASTENTLNKKFIDQYGLTLTQGQFDALITFTYNCGSGWISKTSDNFFNAVKKGATGSELINAFALWCSAGGQILPGLVRRRLSEANMFLNGTYSNSKPADYGYVYYNANGGSVKYRLQGYHVNEGVAPAYTPTYDGRTFLGWFTEKTGGEKVTVLTADLSGDTLYARWEGESTDQPSVPAEGVAVKVNANGVNLRKGPGTNYGIVGTANKGNEMVITETADGTGYQWGKAGEKWIALKFTNYAEVVKDQDEKPEETTEPTEPTETTEPTVPETTEPTEKPTEPEPTEPEATTVTGTIKANGGLALREGPGTGYPRIKYLPNGSKVTILEQKTVGSMTWGKISSGWISMSYVVLDQAEAKPETKPETTTPETNGDQTKLTGRINVQESLRVRSNAGTNYAVVRYLGKDAKVTITQLKNAGGMEWGYIGDGWISMDYVILDKTSGESTTPETKPETTTPETNGDQTNLTGRVNVQESLRVRSGAGTNYALVRYLGKDAKVTITQVRDAGGMKWGYIGDGWISMDYVILDGQQEAQSSDAKTITADCLRVRQTPSTSAQIVGYYYQNAKVQILETKDVDGTTWGKTSKGWISMDYVK